MSNQFGCFYVIFVYVFWRLSAVGGVAMAGTTVALEWDEMRRIEPRSLHECDRDELDHLVARLTSVTIQTWIHSWTKIDIHYFSSFFSCIQISFAETYFFASPPLFFFFYIFSLPDLLPRPYIILILKKLRFCLLSFVPIFPIFFLTSFMHSFHPDLFYSWAISVPIQWIKKNPENLLFSAFLPSPFYLASFTPFLKITFLPLFGTCIILYLALESTSFSIWIVHHYSAYVICWITPYLLYRIKTETSALDIIPLWLADILYMTSPTH